MSQALVPKLSYDSLGGTTSRELLLGDITESQASRTRGSARKDVPKLAQSLTQPASQLGSERIARVPVEMVGVLNRRDRHVFAG